MSNEKKLQDIFIECLEIPKDSFTTELKYNDIPEWDSIGHMSLISAIEEKFSISMETDDIIDFSSYKKGQEILEQKYNLKFG
jgi:acyl carrier protein|tara:strand:- start:2544 stop:2789 length:246 start_codon:yes stop_codon:yes gene_type:complete